MRSGWAVRIKIGMIFFGLAIIFSYAVSAAFAGGLWDGWSGDVFLGYSKTTGNTNKAAGTLSAQALKKFDHSGFLSKGNINYSEANKKMDGQRWDLLEKYYFDFGRKYDWYSFYQVLTDHDYFADIDCRITPGLGVGYHIANTEDWVWDADAGLGYRITRHRIDTAADDEALTAVAHTFAKKRVFEKAFLSEDFTVYPGLKSDAGVIFKSETAFANPLQKNMDLEIKYVVDYNSEPAGKKKADTQIVTGIKYKF